MNEYLIFHGGFPTSSDEPGKVTFKTIGNQIHIRGNGSDVTEGSKIIAESQILPATMVDGVPSLLQWKNANKYSVWTYFTETDYDEYKEAFESVKGRTKVVTIRSSEKVDAKRDPDSGSYDDGVYVSWDSANEDRQGLPESIIVIDNQRVSLYVNKDLDDDLMEWFTSLSKAIFNDGNKEYGSKVDIMLYRYLEENGYSKKIGDYYKPDSNEASRFLDTAKNKMTVLNG